MLEIHAKIGCATKVREYLESIKALGVTYVEAKGVLRNRFVITCRRAALSGDRSGDCPIIRGVRLDLLSYTFKEGSE